MTMISRIAKLALSLGFITSLGLTCVPLGCGSADEAVFPPERPAVQTARRPPEVPADIEKQLRACVQPIPAGLPPAEGNAYAVIFNVQASRSGRVRAVEVKDSTMGGHEVEACFARVLSGMTLPMQELEQLANAMSRRPVVPQGRALVGNFAPALVPVAFPPVVLAFVGFIFMVAILVYVDKTPSISLPLDLPLAATALPTTTAVSSATAIAKPRRNPNQTCDDDVLDRLQEEKGELCDKGYAVNCKKPRGEEQRLDRIPCSKILLSLRQRLACLRQRNLVQEKCFGGVPDAAHKGAIEQVQNGIDRCEALKLLNCAKGHPMSGL